MLTSIRTYDELGNYQLKLPVAELDLTVPFLVKDIQGLGPTEATVSTSTYAGLDGGILQAAKTSMRNIVLKIGYRPDYQSNQTVQSLRRDLYSYFAPKSEVRLRFYSDDYTDVRIVGIVESHEPSIFSKDPEVTISILCPDPYFKAFQATEINGYVNKAVYPSFVGNGEAGFLLELFVTRSISSVSLECAPNEDLVYTDPLIKDDILQISTVRGNKFARLTRGGETTTVLDAINGPMSMKFNPVTQNFYVQVAGASDMTFRLTHTPAYIGI